MLKFSKEPTINKICLKHSYQIVTQVEPNERKKQNGYKLYKCKKCGKTYKKEIPYDMFLGGN